MSKMNKKDIDVKLKKIGVGDSVLEFANSLRKNAFNKNGYRVNSPSGLIGFKRFLEDYTLSSDLAECVPAFQRNNDKWTIKQKQSWILNILKGVNSTILLATYDKGYKHYIIDGYQRVTAIYEFLNDDFKLENGLSVRDIKENNLHKVTMFKVGIRVYEFDTVAESVNFYVEMNENTTHSPEDIKKAKKYLADLAD